MLFYCFSRRFTQAGFFLFLLFASSSSWSISTIPSSKGFTGVLATPIADVLPENEGALTFGKIDSLRKITGIQSFLGFAEVGGSITGDPGDLGLNVKWILPVWQRPDYRLS